MIKLKELEKCMRPQFIWDRNGQKMMQVNEEMEGAKDLARMIFCGIAEMYGFDSLEIMAYIEMEYEGYRNKVQQFRANWREANRRKEEGSLWSYDDPIKKFYTKVSMVLNAIKHKEGSNPFLKLEDFMNNE